MALYYKFVSEKHYDSISMVSPFISVLELKRQIFESKYKAKKDSNSRSGLCFGTDFDIKVINPETNEEYVNVSTLIAKNSKVLIRRVPGGRGGRNPIDVSPIVVGGEKLPKNKESECSGSSTVTALSSNSIWSGSSVSGFDFDTDFDPEFGGDVFAVKQNRGGAVNSASGEREEEKKIPELVSSGAAASDRQQSGNGVGFGGGGWRVPHAGYVCRRCNVAGHFIYHCPTNGDPNYDFKKSRPPTGVLESRLSAVTLDEAAFEKAMEGVPSAGKSRPVPEIPPELLCPFCKNVMSDAVISGRCCFRSFCHKCISDHLVNAKSTCVCGAANILADNLIPNVTLRETIKRYLESGIANNRSNQNNGNSVCEAGSGSASTISLTATPVLPANKERKRPRVEAEEMVGGYGGAPESKKAKVAAVTDEGGKKKKRKRAEVEDYGYDQSLVEGYVPYNYGYNYGLGHYNGAQYGNGMSQSHYYSHQM